jgi:hypothetical protein
MGAWCVRFSGSFNLGLCYAPDLAAVTRRHTNSNKSIATIRLSHYSGAITHSAHQTLRTSSGSLAMFAVIHRAAHPLDCRRAWLHRLPPQSSSASPFTAGAAVFLILSQSSTRSER